MSNNDTIKRGDVLARKCKYHVYDETGCCCDEFAVPVEDINRIPAVPHEMTARELLLTEERMLQEDEDAYREYSRFIWSLKLGDAAAYAERWAKEHPERSEE